MIPTTLRNDYRSLDYNSTSTFRFDGIQLRITLIRRNESCEVMHLDPIFLLLRKSWRY